MRNFLFLTVGLVLIANFVVLMMYGDTLQSTHLFIVRGTVFYPVAFVNLILGISMILYTGITFYKQKNERR
ncbi:MAG TPA: hypothetical protein DCR71_02645 [Dehalococcoidia bacterium]|jgi:hypothetical protein|nr:hypothetical protein [Dehalococcoidia bacterium]